MKRMPACKPATALRTLVVLAAAATAAVTFAADGGAPALPELQAMQTEIQALRATQAQLRDEIREIRALLQKASASAPAAAGPAIGAEVPLQAAQIRGAAAAKLVLVEFSDFQCPFCARHATSTYPQIIRDYVDTGRIRYAFVNFPIDALHPLAFEEHVAAACAADQGRFWEMHDRLFANPKAADRPSLVAHAQVLGLDVARFRECVASERHGDAIREAVRVGNAIGVTGTPTFLIGTSDADGKFHATQIVAGAKPYAAFRDAIDAALGVAAGGTAPPVAAGVGAMQAGWKLVEEAQH